MTWLKESCNYSRIQRNKPFSIEMYLQTVEIMANSADPDQTARSSLIWIYTVCLDKYVQNSLQS